ncbi:uncharacterized protein B0I36DRAFT_313951 [Microdochium trichocladiopsis]|uniref:Uncharacterized protein n=1 Tax=Microdochium trichocladiopsis TaxID=1682393 RepID=A0A9P9BTV3_9PEZI|nr:uncharacterized protein B0I36DRAFT_313951 [Microdochium trichocladiopsis]KAH7037392.1 hypothetical protein B0I36DRAFT_313951 [Microdochium trichocladiopsis]
MARYRGRSLCLALTLTLATWLGLILRQRQDSMAVSVSSVPSAEIDETCRMSVPGGHHTSSKSWKEDTKPHFCA